MTDTRTSYGGPLVVSALALLALVLPRWTANDEVHEHRAQLEQHLAEIRARNESLRRTNAQAMETIDRLSDDEHMVERRLREEERLLRHDEVVFFFASPRSAGPPPHTP